MDESRRYAEEDGDLVDSMIKIALGNPDFLLRLERSYPEGESTYQRYLSAREELHQFVRGIVDGLEGVAQEYEEPDFLANERAEFERENRFPYAHCPEVVLGCESSDIPWAYDTEEEPVVRNGRSVTSGQQPTLF